jgi:hypothetical protein
MARRSSPIGPSMTGGGGAVVQYRSTQILLVILSAQGFSEKTKLILLRLNSSKKFPHNSPLIFGAYCTSIVYGKW